MLRFDFTDKIRYEDRQSRSGGGKELLRNEKDLTEANLGSALLGRHQSNVLGEPEPGGLGMVEERWRRYQPLENPQSAAMSSVGSFFFLYWDKSTFPV